MEYEEFKLEVTGAPAIKFAGTLIAEDGSSDETSHPDYSGYTGRWDELQLYKTKGGKFVCYRAEYTRWCGSKHEYSAKVCTTEQEVIKFFGQDRFAQRLYNQAGIENSTFVE